MIADPATRLCAALNGWQYPASRESLVLMDIFDLQHARSAEKRPEPYPRPWPQQKGGRRAKPDARLTQEEIIAALRRAGHTAPIPLAPERR